MIWDAVHSCNLDCRTGIFGKRGQRRDRGIPQFSKLSYRKFQFHLISLPEFPVFWVEWIAPLVDRESLNYFPVLLGQEPSAGGSMSEFAERDRSEGPV